MDVVAEAGRFDVFLVGLNPVKGSEIRKTRPCVIVSPDEMNRYLRTVIIAPMTTTLRGYPTRIDVTFQRKKGQVALDQIRTVDKARLIRRLGKLPDRRAQEISEALVEMFAYG